MVSNNIFYINKSVIFMGVSGWKDKYFRLPHDIESSLFGFSDRVNVSLIKNQCCYNVSHNSFTMLVIVLRRCWSQYWHSILRVSMG